MKHSTSRGALVTVGGPLDGVYRRDFAVDRSLATPDPYSIDNSLLVADDSDSESEAPAEPSRRVKLVQDEPALSGREVLFEVTIVQTLARPSNLDYLLEQEKNVWDKTRDLARQATIKNLKEHTRNWRVKARERKEVHKPEAQEAHRGCKATSDDRQSHVRINGKRLPTVASSQPRPGRKANSSSANQQKSEEDSLDRDARLCESWIRGTNYHGLRQPIEVDKPWW